MPLIPDFNFFNINFFSSYVKQLRNWCTFFADAWVHQNFATRLRFQEWQPVLQKSDLHSSNYPVKGFLLSGQAR